MSVFKFKTQDDAKEFCKELTMSLRGGGNIVSSKSRNGYFVLSYTLQSGSRNYKNDEDLENAFMEWSGK